MRSFRMSGTTLPTHIRFRTRGDDPSLGGSHGLRFLPALADSHPYNDLQDSGGLIMSVLRGSDQDSERGKCSASLGTVLC